MADLIPFPGRPDRSAPAYQLHRFTPDGSVRTTLLIVARNDFDAGRQARRMTDGMRSELWSGSRFLNHFAPVDHPVAASIRLLDDPRA